MITSKDICKALLDRYTHPEYALCFEVGDGTGGDLHRHADAVAMNLYPSRGYEITGFEIKVSKSDLQSELNSPDKAEAISKYCDYWFLVVPKGLCDTKMIPIPWGILEYNDGSLRIKKRPVQLEQHDISKKFMAGMLRASFRERDKQITDRVQKRLQLEYEQRKSDIEQQIKLRMDEQSRSTQRLLEIEKLLGKHVTWSNPDVFVRKYKIAESLDKIFYNNYDSLIDLGIELNNTKILLDNALANVKETIEKDGNIIE